MTWLPQGARQAWLEAAAGSPSPLSHSSGSRLARALGVPPAARPGLKAAAPWLVALALQATAASAWANAPVVPAAQAPVAAPADRTTTGTAQGSANTAKPAEESEQSMLMLGLATAAVLLLLARRRFVR